MKTDKHGRERETCHTAGKFTEEKERKSGRERSSKRMKAGRELQGATTEQKYEEKV